VPAEINIKLNELKADVESALREREREIIDSRKHYLVVNSRSHRPRPNRIVPSCQPTNCTPSTSSANDPLYAGFFSWAR
jgi:hypothetical protein